MTRDDKTATQPVTYTTHKTTTIISCIKGRDPHGTLDDKVSKCILPEELRMVGMCVVAFIEFVPPEELRKDMTKVFYWICPS